MKLNVPYGELWSGVKKVAQFSKPLGAHALAGSLAGAGIGAISGEGHTLRDGLIGGAVGALGSPMGRSYLKSFNRGAGRVAGEYDLKAGAMAIKSRAVGRWNGIGRLK
jgi:uncharacterized membrane protein